MITLAAILVLAIDPATAAFDMIQIDWIADTGTVRNMEQVINTPAAQLIRLLGDERYQVRRLAAREIRFLGDDAFEALCWGRRVDSVAIAHACRLLISDLFRCPACDGCGKAQIAGTKGESEWDYEDCKPCCATGDLRMELEYSWDDAVMGQVITLRERNFFPRRRDPH